MLPRNGLRSFKYQHWHEKKKLRSAKYDNSPVWVFVRDWVRRYTYLVALNGMADAWCWWDRPWTRTMPNVQCRRVAHGQGLHQFMACYFPSPFPLSPASLRRLLWQITLLQDPTLWPFSTLIKILMGPVTFAAIGRNQHARSSIHTHPRRFSES